MVGKEKLLVDPKNEEVINGLPLPTTVWGIQSFLCQATDHRKFIWMYAEITWPLKIKKGRSTFKPNLARTPLKK